MDTSTATAHSGLPRVDAFKGALRGVVDETITSGASVVIKHYADPANKPDSDLWQIGMTPKLTFALNVDQDCSLIIEWTVDDGTTFYALNPILLTHGANDLTGLHIPGEQVRFTVMRSNVTADATISGVIRMEAA